MGRYRTSAIWTVFLLVMPWHLERVQHFSGGHGIWRESNTSVEHIVSFFRVKE
jgi:hypothetical protein